MANNKRAAVIIAAVVSFTAMWEGTDLVAKKDMIGTGHPLTYCHGQTDEFGKVKAGQRFTPAQCDKLLAESLPKYLEPLQKCIKQDIPVESMAAGLDAAYNAGSAAVCKSPMVAHFNAGDIRGGCEAFYTETIIDGKRVPTGWYIRASGRIVQGLINRRIAEKNLCLKGLGNSTPKTSTPKPASKPAPLPWWKMALLYLKGN